MKFFAAVLLASLAVVGPAWGWSCREEQPMPLKDYVQRIAATYPVIVEVQLLDFKVISGGSELTAEVTHVWKGPLARGGNTLIRSPTMLNETPRHSLQEFGGKRAIWLLFLKEDKDGLLWSTGCNPSVLYPGPKAGSRAALYYALMVELDAYFSIDRSKREPLRLMQ
jgi:hypothetical protein